MRQLRNCVQLKISKTFRWPNTKNSKKQLVDPICVGEEHGIIAVDAAMKLQTAAKMRLNRARANFEAAATELKEAEREVADATKYTKSVKSYCKKCQENQPNASDYVFVNAASTNNVTGTKKRVVIQEKSTHAPKDDESQNQFA